MSAPTSNLVATLAVVGAFAGLVTVHVATCFGLIRRRYGGPAVAAILMPPTAPYWAFRRGMRGRSVLWVAFLVAYAVAFICAR